MFAYTKIMQGIQAVSAAVTDAYFNLVTLLLPGNGTNGAQNNTFLDSSTNNFTITRNGNTTQGTFSPFSQTGWSNYFNGSTDYFNFAAQSGFSFGTGDWAIETFVYLTSTADQAIYDARPTSTNGLYPLVDIAGGKFRYYTNSASRIESDSTFSTNRWYHIVVSRVSGTTRMFIDGTVQSTTYTDSNNYIVGTNRPTIGVGGFNLTAHLSGYLSNMRVLKGSGYTSVTVPTAPLTAVTNTQLLICQSNRFVDNSTNAFTITVNGTPSVQAFSPFAPTAAYSAATNGGSGYFDGTGDFLSAVQSAFVATGDLTIEAWVYCTKTGAFQGVVSTTSNTDTSGFRIAIDSSNRAEFGIFGSSVVTSTAFQMNAWNHLAMSRSGTASNNISCYVNGSRVGQLSVNTSTTNSSLAVGRYRPGEDANYFQGYICGIKYVVGTASYSGTTITVPTAPPDPSGSTLCLNFTNAGITDATAKNDLETVGNAQISTTQSKFGGSSMYFDGNDKCTAPYTQNFNLGTTYTIEGWIYPTTVTGYQRIFDIVNSATSAPAFLDVALNGSALVSELRTSNGGGVTTISGGTVSANTWSHVALSVSAGSAKLFLNGTQVGSTTTFSALPDQNFIGVGGIGNSLTIDYFTGYIDDLRITKGYARYTASFTAPTAAFPTQ
jgi:hypothetical protein